MCDSPLVRYGGAVVWPCQKCFGCRMNKRRKWTHRLLLEAGCHKKFSFLTLTYAPDHLPENGSLVPSQLSAFVKRVRARFSWGKILRFYGVGEYGDKYGRPHYHVIFFGLGVEWRRVFQSCWSFGTVDVREGTSNFCQYICGYVVKGMTRRNDGRLSGRAPEFVRMSRRPGIGAFSVRPLVDSFTRPAGAWAYSVEGDVPFQLKRGGKLWPLDRYLRGKVRDALGYKKVDFADTATGINQKAKLLALRQDVSVSEGRVAIRKMREEARLSWRLRQQGLDSATKWKARNPYNNRGRF